MKPLNKNKSRSIEITIISIAIPLLMILVFHTGRLFQEAITLEPEVITISSPVSEVSIEVNRQADTHGGFAEMLDYVIQCESKGDMSAIGQAGEIGILQYKLPSWEFLSDKYDFTGSIYNKNDQINLFLKAVQGGDGHHWTCWRKYQSL